MQTNFLNHSFRKTCQNFFLILKCYPFTFAFNIIGKEITPEKDLVKDEKNVEDLPLPKEDDQMIENDEEDADQEQDEEQDEDKNQEDEGDQDESEDSEGNDENNLQSNDG